MEKPKQQQKQLFIHIPQGCYGKITPATPNHVIGFMTENLFTCTFLVVTNKYKSHFFACHMDYATNIEDDILGLPAWIEEISKAKSMQNKYVNIEIHYQKRESKIRRSYFHSSKITSVLEKKGFVLDDTESYKDIPEVIYTNKEKKIILTEVQHPNIEDNIYGLAIRGKTSKFVQKAFKTSKNISYPKGINFNYSTNISFYDDTVNKFNDKIKLITSTKLIHKIFVDNQRSQLCKKLSFKDCAITNELYFPPICCFNGTNKDLDILKTYKMQQREGQKQLLQEQYQEHIQKYFVLYKEIIEENKENFKLPSNNIEECEEYIEEYCIELTKQFITKMTDNHKQNNLRIKDVKEKLLLNSRKSNIFQSSSNEEYKCDTMDSVEDEIGEVVELSIKDSDTVEEKTEYSDIPEEEPQKTVYSNYSL